MGKRTGLFWGIFLLSFFISHEGRGERPTTSNPYQYVVGQGPIAFSQGGAAMIPLNVLSATANGQLSPVMQFVLVNSMMTKCIKNAAKDVPGRRDPFKLANLRFTTGYCKIRKCFEQAMLLSMLSQTSSNANYGGSSDAAEQQSSQMMMMMLGQAFQKGEACGGASDKGIDPALIQAANK